MRYLLGTAAALAVAGPACAQDLEVRPLAEVRLRNEHVEQDGLPREADAVTARIRTGVEIASGRWSATVQGQGTLALVDHYDDGLHGPADRPQVSDPQNIGLYVAQLQYRTTGAVLTAGRQKIALEDERFVGNAGIRDNAQTYDAVRAQLSPVAGLRLDISYAWSVRTIWGIDGRGARQQAIGGDNVFANLSYATPIGTLSGFAYLVDQDEAAVQGYRLSSRTYGARLSGSRAFSPAVKLDYVASYARQWDHHRNPNDYHADYWLADATLDVRGWKLNAGYEVLGAGDGTPFTSFQTPLGSNFKFQGWTDKFLTTPANGIRDLYFGAGYGVKQVGPLTGVAFQAVWHRLDSDRLNQHYGNEVDLLASAKLRKPLVSLRYAHYDAREFATDTDKYWIQLDWTY